MKHRWKMRFLTLSNSGRIDAINIKFWTVCYWYNNLTMFITFTNSIIFHILCCGALLTMKSYHCIDIEYTNCWFHWLIAIDINFNCKYFLKQKCHVDCMGFKSKQNSIRKIKIDAIQIRPKWTYIYSIQNNWTNIQFNTTKSNIPHK